MQELVAASLGHPAGRLVMVVKSAHVYATEFEYTEGVLALRRGRGKSVDLRS